MTEDEAGVKVAGLYMNLEERMYFQPGYDAFNKGFLDAARIALHQGSLKASELFSLPDREAVNQIAENDEAREHLNKVFEHFVYEDGLEEVEENPDLTVQLRRDVVDPKIRDYTDQNLDEMDRASSKLDKLAQKMKSHRSKDGRTIGFNVIGWDYPEIEGYDVEGEIPAQSIHIPRISEPGTPFADDYWSNIHERYRKEDRKSYMQKI
ncbi:MAG: hypothetical protein V5A72_00145 [Candidatus Nanohaloarchaea archaeon]